MKANVSHIHGEQSPEAALTQALGKSSRMEAVVVLTLEREDDGSQIARWYRSRMWTHEMAYLGTCMQRLVLHRLECDSEDEDSAS